MNKRHYEHTLPNIRGSLSNTYGRTTSLATSVNKQCMVLLSDKVRLATEQDFDDFHICFDGFRNNTMYCYNQGTEPIYLQ